MSPHPAHPVDPADLPDGPICVGFSGGLDSTVLLHALSRLPEARALGLRAVHVHHGLQTQADAWAVHCEQACRVWDVPVAVRLVSVAPGGEGPEAAARAARREAFAAELHPGESLALAHHRDDQAETVLMRALRGAGPDGLSAMAVSVPFAAGRLWRPLLALPRAALLAHARQHDLVWIEDPSNADTALDRNFLRRQVMPLLRERWPHADAALARVGALAAESVELLEEGDAQAIAQVAGAEPTCLSRPALLALPRARRARVLRRWVASLGLPPLPGNGVARIESELLQAPPDADACFQWHGANVRAWRGLLHAGPVQAPLPTDWQVAWDGRHALPLPGGGELALQVDAGAQRFDPPLTVGARRGGERIHLPGRAHGHALKQVLQDLGVPPWRRERLPLAWDRDGTLLAAGDVAYSARFDAWLRERGGRLRWQPTGVPVDRAERAPAHPAREDHAGRPID
ncbi:tRNA lysidine(34) synthetase TilS [Lysobacter sp. A3-1-A15]|uniref:tRNA lysidine(34) synthetase TilS n=1 Tax=Novilysobacter viscosus TaxID=3098602 RepID=UPI003982E875